MNWLLQFYPGESVVYWGLLILAQATVLLLAGCLTAIMLRRHPAIRHCILTGCVIAVLVLPFVCWTCQSVGLSWQHLFPEVVSQFVSATDGVAADVGISYAEELHPGERRAIDNPESSPKTAEATPRGVIPESLALEWSTHSAFSVPGNLQRTLVTAMLLLWLAGSLWLLLRLCRGYVILHQLRRESTPIHAGEYRDVLERVAARVGGWRLPPIAISGQVRSPVYCGVFRPLVFLPDTLLTEVDRTELTDILVHECAHHVRRDAIVLWLQRMVTMLWWPHPGVHLLNRLLGRAREELCDNYVLRQQEASEYSSTLLRLSRQMGAPTIPVLSFASSRWSLEKRIAGLLANDRNRTTGLGKSVRAAVALAVASVVLILAGGTSATGAANKELSNSGRLGASTLEGSVLQEQRTDLYGDPLPEGAIARAGSIRLRPGDMVEQVYFSPNGLEVVSWSGGLSNNSVFCRWDATTGQLIGKHEFPATQLMTVGYLGARNSLAVLQSSEGELHFWDFIGGEAPPQIIDPGPTRDIAVSGLDGEQFTRFALSPDGTLLAGGTRGKSDNKRLIRLWKYKPGKELDELELVRELPRVMDQIDWIRFTEDGSGLVTLCGKPVAEGTLPDHAIAVRAEVFVWDVETGNKLAQFDPGMINCQGYNVAATLSSSLTPTGTLLAIASPDKSIRVFDLATGDVRREVNCDEIIHCLRFLSNNLLASGGRGGLIRVWNLDDGRETVRLEGHGRFVESIDVSPDSRTLISGSQDLTVRMWDLESGQEKLSTPGHKKPGCALSISSNGKWFVTGGRDGKVLFWETETGKLLDPWQLDQDIHALAISSDDRLTAVGSNLGNDPALGIFYTDSGMPLHSFEGQGAVGLNSLVYSPDGKWLYAGDRNQPVVCMWGIEKGELVRQFEFSQPLDHRGEGPRVNCVALSRDGIILACDGSTRAAGSHVIYLWETRTGGSIGEIALSKGAINCLVFLPDGSGLVSGGHSLQLWNIEKREPVRVYSGTTNAGTGRRWINGIAISPDGLWIATAERGGAIEIYNVESGELQNTLRHANNVDAVQFSPDGRRLVSLGADLTALVWDFDEVLEKN